MNRGGRKVIKSRTKKYYDVKSFLNKDKSRRSFVSFTFTGSAIRSIALFVFVIFLIPLMLVMFKETEFLSAMVRTGVYNAHPFFDIPKGDNISYTEIILLRGVSNLFGMRTTTEKEVKEEKPQPKVNILPQKSASNGIDIKNETDYNIDVAALLGEDIKLSMQNPKVLIVHTHGSESYTSSPKYKYTPSGNYRTQNTDFNVIRVGEELASQLRKKGVEVIHDKTINDYPSYNDSYNKTGRIIEDYLAKDSSIAFVFDIHRDAVGEGDSIVKFVSDVKGKSVAQVMIVCGSDTNLQNPNWQENLKLGIHIQNRFERDYPGFLRPLNLRKERFNMHLTSGSLLFEVGTNGNTMDEALAAAAFLGEGIGQMISELESKTG